MNSSPNPTTQRVLEAIAKDGIGMRSVRTHRFRQFLVGLGAFFVAVVLFWHSSFELFVIAHNGQLYLLTLGWPGFLTFLRVFSWGWTVVGTLLLIILVIIIRRATKAYRLTGLAVFGFLLVGVSLVGFMIYSTPLQYTLHRSAMDQAATILGYDYEQRADIESPLYETGVVTEKDANTYTIIDRAGITETVVTTSTTKQYDGSIEVGDAIIAIGKRNDRVITATAIRPLPQKYLLQSLNVAEE